MPTTPLELRRFTVQVQLMLARQDCRSFDISETGSQQAVLLCQAPDGNLFEVRVQVRTSPPRKAPAIKVQHPVYLACAVSPLTMWMSPGLLERVGSHVPEMTLRPLDF